MTIACVVI
jgi:hypothetical protein